MRRTVRLSPNSAAALVGLCVLAGCGGQSAERLTMLEASRSQVAQSGATPEMARMIAHYAAAYDVPLTLVHRVVQRESSYRPAARNGHYYGLMQILPATARTMGYRGGPDGLLDAETNLRYGVKYLRGAWLVSGGSEEKAVMWYSKGYYFEAKRMGLLEETGLRS